jgi:hypothetical protein
MATLEHYDFDPRNLPPDVLAAIGLMTTSAAHTESCVDEAIAGCLGIDLERAVYRPRTIACRTFGSSSLRSDRPILDDIKRQVTAWLPRYPAPPVQSLHDHAPRLSDAGARVISAELRPSVFRDLK